MTRLSKRIEVLRASARSTSPSELESILLALGFERRPGKGDHRIYRHAGTGVRLIIDPRKPLLPVYVRLALKAIDEVLNHEDK